MPDVQDAFGPFSDSAAASGSDPFTFPSNIAESMAADDSSFGDFGDFGDFQSASGSFEEGVLTPTGADSWSFASASSTSSLDEAERRPGETGRVDQDDQRTARD